MTTSESSRKTVLLVDDDIACLRYLASKFNEETQLIPIVARDLEQATQLLRDLSVMVDAVVADIFFGESRRSETLNDGLDLLQFAATLRPTCKLYVLSFFANREARERAESTGTQISGWFQKGWYEEPTQTAPWALVEAQLLGVHTLASRQQRPNYDVFISYNSRDRDEVQRITRALEARGLQPWIDVWHLPPGRLFQDELDKIIPKAGAIAVFVGTSGLGPWEQFEQKAAIGEFIRRGLPVIPVLLGIDMTAVKVPIFLREFGFVRFSNEQSYEQAISDLIWGIKGGSRASHNNGAT